MTRRRAGATFAVILALSSCTAGTPQPRGTSTPSPSPSPTPVATSVWCDRTTPALQGGVLVGGTSEAKPAVLAETLDAGTATITSRQMLNRNRARRDRWRRDLTAEAAAGQLIVVLQLGDYQRESALAFARAGAIVVLALPLGTELGPLRARYPKGSLFVVTSGGAVDDAELTHAEATELTSVLHGVVRCAPLPTPSPSPSASVSPSPTASGSRATCGPARARRPIRYVVDVEPGISTSAQELTSILLDIYCDAKGWTRTGRVSFATAPRRTSGVTLIRLANREGVRRHCTRLLGEQASGNYSCASHAANEIVLNNVNWENGTRDFLARGGTLTQYRTMVATHEMGHVLDLRHQLCRTDGAPAPVMMQQSISMTSESTGKTCEPNPWPLQDEIDRLKRRWS